MEFRAPHSELLQILSSIEKVLGKSSISVLSHVLIEADEQNVQFTVTDLEVCVTRTFKCDVLKPGACTMPAKKLREIWEALPSGTHTFQVDSKFNGLIDYNTGQFRIFGFGREEYPPIAKCGVSKSFVIDQKTLKDALFYASISMSTDETRQVLNSVYFHSDDTLKIVSTDGRRLSIYDTELKTQKLGVVIPAKTIRYLISNLGDTGTVRVSIEETLCRFDWTGHKLISKIVDAQFPDYKRVVPDTNNGVVCNINRQELLGSVHRIALMQEIPGAITLEFDKNLKISLSTDTGDGIEEVACNWSEAPFKIGFNPEFLMAVLRSGDINASFVIAPNAPFVISTKQNFKYILMPMRTL